MNENWPRIIHVAVSSVEEIWLPRLDVDNVGNAFLRPGSRTDVDKRAVLTRFFFACFFFAGGDHCGLGNDCHGDAKCVNGLFSYTCHCNEGFIGDGRNSCQGKMILKETEFLYWL